MITRKLFKKLFMIMLAALPLSATAAELQVQVANFAAGQKIPEKFANCKYSPAKGESEPAGNVSPKISWSEGKLGTKSYALIMVDGDVPADFSPANKQGKTIPEAAARRDFYHWGIAGISGNILALPEGISKADTAIGAQSRNDFGNTGYDGPCPPWNDERVHKYRFQVYALDTDLRGLTLNEKFHAKDLLNAIKPHILSQGEAILTYTNNPNIK